MIDGVRPVLTFQTQSRVFSVLHSLFARHPSEGVSGVQLDPWGSRVHYHHATIDRMLQSKIIILTCNNNLYVFL